MAIGRRFGLYSRITASLRGFSICSSGGVGVRRDYFPIRSYCPIDCGLPLKTGESALALVVSACSAFIRITACTLAKPSIETLYTEGFSDSVAPLALL